MLSSLACQVFNRANLKCLIVHITGLFFQVENIDLHGHVSEGQSHGLVPIVNYCVGGGENKCPKMTGV